MLYVANEIDVKALLLSWVRSDVAYLCTIVAFVPPPYLTDDMVEHHDNVEGAAGVTVGVFQDRFTVLPEDESERFSGGKHSLWH
jgi:hypothetical protein